MFEQVSEAIKQEIDRGHAPCCSIVCHGPKGQFIQCFGIEDIDRDRKIDRNTRFPMGCVTKMFISAAVFQLCVVEGINMESPIQKALYGIPAFADLEFAKYVSINDVLTHSIGITNNALKHYLLSHESSSTVVNVINDEFDILKFRKQYNYSSMPFVILQYVIEYITGMSWKSYIEKSIFQPAGIEKIAFIEEFDKGNQHNMALPYIRKEKRFIRGDLIIMESFDSGLGLVLNTDEIARLFAHNFLFTCDSFIKQACVPQRNTFGGLPFREVLYDFSSVCGNIMQIANEKILYHIGNYPGYSSFLGYCVNAKMYISIMTNVSNSLLPIVYALSLAENRDENVQKWNARFKFFDSFQQDRKRAKMKSIQSTDDYGIEGQYTNTIYPDVVISRDGNRVYIVINNKEYNLIRVGRDYYRTDLYDGIFLEIKVEGNDIVLSEHGIEGDNLIYKRKGVAL